MSGMPPAAGASSFGASVTIASVVISSDATDAASVSAVRTTLVGSTTPASIMFTNQMTYMRKIRIIWFVGIVVIHLKNKDFVYRDHMIRLKKCIMYTDGFVQQIAARLTYWSIRHLIEDIR